MDIKKYFIIALQLICLSVWMGPQLAWSYRDKSQGKNKEFRKKMKVERQNFKKGIQEEKKEFREKVKAERQSLDKSDEEAKKEFRKKVKSERQ